jgi:hypothetical protein
MNIAKKEKISLFMKCLFKLAGNGLRLGAGRAIYILQPGTSAQPA